MVDLKVRLCNSFVFSSETTTRGEVSLLQFTVGVGIRANFVLQTWRMSLPFLKKKGLHCVATVTEQYGWLHLHLSSSLVSSQLTARII